MVVAWHRHLLGRARFGGGGGRGEVGGRRAAGGCRLMVVVVVFSQDKVLQRLVEQITVDSLGLDRVQQRFVEQDLEALRVGV